MDRRLMDKTAVDKSVETDVEQAGRERDGHGRFVKKRKCST
jgi:hypothetical protein